jgi:hypothetical protein
VFASPPCKTAAFRLAVINRAEGDSNMLEEHW